ncbi:MAG: ABC transporter permease [Candidatus Koribacter versatilis]|uniref:Transport permease protein n=1 Tax=Candidatus Korobacter versatilis TaxID=658062 RepID=A0A932A6N0_9BACT|nr:ABC transporter permease [Candidatus Koribacter versatilis]
MKASLLEKLYLIVLRDLRTGIRYRGGFWMEVAGTFAELSTFFFLAAAIGGSYRPQGMDYFSFLVIGTSVLGFLAAGVYLFVNTVRQAQMTGTMEVLMTTATPGWIIILLTAISSFTARLLPTVLYIAAGLFLFGAPVGAVRLAPAAVVFVLSILVALAIGMLAGAMQVALQRGGGVTTLIATVASFFCGAMFPINALPRTLQLVSRAIPFTYSIHGLRATLVAGSSLGDVSTDIVALAAFAAVLLPIGTGVFALALRRARQQGTLSFY